MKQLRPVYIILAAASALLLILPVFTEGMNGSALSAYAPVCILCLLPVLAVFLVLRRKAMADKELADMLTILKWELPQDGGIPFARRIMPPLAVLLAVICAAATVLLLWSNASVTVTLCLCGFFLCSLSLIIINTAANRLADFGGTRGFRLCHNALYLCGTRIKLDGEKCAIYQVSLDEDAQTLRLGIMHRGATNDINIGVPAEQIETTRAFIADLEAHLNARDESSAQP